MIQQSIEYFGSHFWSIFALALFSMLLWRLIVGFSTFSSAMLVLRKNIASTIALGLSLLYLILPVDFIPDLLLVIGWIDDAVIAVGAISYARNALSQMIWGELPVKRRVSTLLGWFLIFLLGAWILRFGIFLLMG